MNEMQYLGDNACPTMTHHDTTAYVPVCVRAFAEPGPVIVECAGNPSIQSGFGTGGGTERGCCEFTISQRMRVNIPIAFGANVQIGEIYVNCGQTTGVIDDTDCPNCPGLSEARDSDL